MRLSPTYRAGVSAVYFLFACIGLAASAQTPHPHLYLTQSDLASIKERLGRPNAQVYRSIADEIIRAANSLLARDVPVYDRPGRWHHLYICDGKGDGNDDPNDGCGGYLLFEEDRPYDHICPRCGKVYRGSPYDEAWISYYNDLVARHIRNLGLAYLLSDDQAYAEKAAGLCLRYAELYPNFPLRDISGGKSTVAARLYDQTLAEAVWIFDLLWGLDAIYDSEVISPTDRRFIEESLLRRVVATLSRTDLGTSNIQAWISGAIGAIGFFLEDQDFIEQAISGPRGYHYLLGKAFGADGFSVEGSVSYHYYAIRPLVYLARIAERAGRRLWDERLRKALVTPLYLVEPDGNFPRLNDAGRLHLRNLVDLYEMCNGLSEDRVFDQVLTEVYRIHRYRRAHFLALFAGDDFLDTSGLTPPGVVPDSLGIEVLTGDQSVSSLMVLLDRGPHGGWHGHDDKLNVILFGQARELAVDLGTGSLAAELLNGWLRRTISHNTILVGEYGQNPGPDWLSPITFKQTSFTAVQVVAAKPAYAVYPGRTDIQRTVLKVKDDYLLVRDTVSEAQPPIDLAWHALGRFVFSASYQYEPTGLLEHWRSSINGYQYLRPPWFLGRDPEKDILQIPPDTLPVNVVWRLPLGLSDDMEDLTMWEGECALSEKRTEGRSSLRFLALPNRTVRVAKDLSHPNLDLSSLETLEFDYFLDPGRATRFFVVLQHLPSYDRAVWYIPSLQPGVWHHAVLDLRNPDEVAGGSDGRTRLELGVSAVGEPEDSFFVYIDNLQAKSADRLENPLAIGIAATLLSTPPASHLLADGPGLRPGDRHPVLLSRVPGKNAVFVTMLEAYADRPRWSLTTTPEGNLRIVSHEFVDFLKIDGDKHQYSLARRRRDEKPELLVLFNSFSGAVGPCEVESEKPFDLQLQVETAASGKVEYHYNTGSIMDSFIFRTVLPARYSSVVFDGRVWEGPLLIQGERIELGPLPGGEHRVELRTTLPPTVVEGWRLYGR